MGWKFLLTILLSLALTGCDRTPSTSSSGDETNGPSSAPESMEQWIQSRARPLGSPADLKPLVEEAGRRDLILLGEASHGTREFYTWRADFSLALADSPGLDFIALEADWHSVLPLHDFIRGEGSVEDLERLLITTFERWPQWMWANEEFRDFLVQLRQFNSDHPERPIHLYGIDVQSPFPALDVLVELTNTHHPERARELDRELRCIARYQPEIREYGRALHDRGHNHHGHGHDHGHHHNHQPPSEPAFGREGEEDCLPSMERMLAITREIFSDQSLESIRARKSALVVAAGEAQQRAHFIQERGITWNTRARAMYRLTADLLQSHGPDARGAVWAHNTHIGDARATYMIDQHQENMGQLARQELGPERVFAIGFSTFSGQVLAAERWGLPVEELPVPEALTGSFDYLLHQAGMEQFFVTFETDDRALPFFQERIGHRAIGVVYQPRNERFVNYVATIPPARYDGLIFLAHTTPLNPLQ